MKKILSVILLVGLMMPMWVSCSSDEEYYVRYEVTRGKPFNAMGGESTYEINYRDVGKNSYVNQRSSWEGTYGPFPTGEKVFLQVRTLQGGYSACARISVSQDNKNFVIKEEKNNEANIQLFYYVGD